MHGVSSFFFQAVTSKVMFVHSRWNTKFISAAYNEICKELYSPGYTINLFVGPFGLNCSVFLANI